MALMDIYNNAKNPIDDENIIRKFIELYSKSTNHSFYGCLVRANGNVDSSRYSPKDCDAFYAMLFNIWKKSITSMTKEEYIKLYQEGALKSDFVKLRNFLLRTPDASTREEVNAIIFANREDKELEEAFDKYKWSSFGEYSGWEHICSRYMHAKKEKHQPVEHRIYIRVDSIGIYRLCKCFTEECEKQHIPYYFKFSAFDNRDDSIVVYSSTKYLNKYIEILNKIKEEHKELQPYIGKAPLLSASIEGGWLGYGSEPTCKRENGDLYSFNDLRAEIIEKSIEKTTQNWLQNHMNMIIPYGGRRITFSDYLMMKTTEYFIHKLSRQYDSEKNIRIKKAEKSNTQFDESEVIKACGYSKQKLESIEFKNYVYRLIASKKDEYIKAMSTGNYKGISKIDIVVANNKKLWFTSKDLINTIKGLVPIIVKSDSTFIGCIQNEIKKESSKYNIDTNNFAFDIPTVRRMQQYDQQQNQPKEELESMLKKEIKRPRMRYANETDEEYERYLKEFYGGNSLI